MPSAVEFAEVLRQRIDIVDVVGSYVPLKPAGANHKGCCPFHQEKTPSFTVHQGKQIFHCFGCGKGGDIVRFICEIEHLQFTDALRFLADKFNIPIPSFSNKPGHEQTVSRDRRKTLQDAGLFAQKFFAQRLQAELTNPNTEAAQYIAKRALTPELCTHFNLGLSPVTGWQQLLDAAQKANIPREIMVEAGLVIDREGKQYDRFRNRIMFPIHDANGHPVAFGGRVYHSSAKPEDPKYINSPETELYKKGQQLYAFHLARPAIQEKQSVILMEGYLDVIRSHQYGFTNAVATCGTALTTEQARLLKRHTNRAILVYDGDSAGQKAMIRAAEIMLPMEFNLSFVVLPGNHDPDSFLREGGAEPFQRLITNGLNTLTFLLQIADRLFPANQPESKASIVSFIAPHINRIPNPVLREEYVRILADRLSVSTHAIGKVLSAITAGEDSHHAASMAFQKPAQYTPEPRNETLLVKTFVEHPEAQQTIIDTLTATWLKGAKTRAMFELFSNRLPSPNNWNQVIDHCPDDILRSFCTQIAVMDFPEITSNVIKNNMLPQILSELIDRLSFFYYKKQATRIIRLLQETDSFDDQGEHMERKLQQFDQHAKRPFILKHTHKG